MTTESETTEDSSTAPQRWEKLRTRGETDLTIEAMQVTEPYVDDLDNVDNLMNLREKRWVTQRTERGRE